MILDKRIEKLEELLGVKNENRIILVMEDDYRFDDEEEKKDSWKMWAEIAW